ncbi:E3 ubiquitin-protein ligase RNFT1-like isoform X1 [Cynara cardunculus var. scolymus]|uniref:E3 ubiquitin-protein ligase RNFT1-like isoform X1 n=1 Tax=Cynara cardunculus var. scolymus TaxID=59895 RepID=UPI000D6282FF|nr:E3 ubiquitin-protein ligase RNFT1-like isoform X1 [Cynara cardunculus var. scolymus]
METSGLSSDAHRGSLASTSTSDHHYHHSRRNNGNNHFSASNFFRSPVSAFLEYMGILQTQRTSHSESSDSLINDENTQNDSPGSGDEEVSIRIIGSGEQGQDRDGGGASSSTIGQIREGTAIQNESLLQSISRTASAATMDTQGDSRSDGVSASIRGAMDSVSGNVDSEAAEGVGVNNSRDSSYQRYDIQQAARWAEQVLPFTLLLLVVFIRQHLQGITGFFVTIWITAFMFKSNDILRRQTALKGERKILVLASISLLFTLHVAGVYWWYRKDDLLYPLVMLPPKSIPPFWHAIFLVIVNDTLARQAAMVLKCFLLMYYKNSRGRNRRKQGQMLTLVEYLLLLYRVLLPAPVWYRFFLNKEYGSLFSSLMTGLYLTFKLTCVVEKVQSLISAIKALSRREIHYGAYATSEQVNAPGELCAICQEKMHSPVVLRCKHVFCEECVSEWFERERTCPLCRALVRAADLRSFGDGSTTLYFQLF